MIEIDFFVFDKLVVLLFLFNYDHFLGMDYLYLGFCIWTDNIWIILIVLVYIEINKGDLEI